MDNIAHSLKRIVNPSELIISRAMVQDTNGRTCKVRYDSTGFVRDNVLLSLCPEENRILLIPEKNSDVYVAEAEGYDAFIVGYGQVGSISITVDGISLKEVINELFTTLRDAIISTPSGAGNISMETQQKLANINENLNKIFK